MLLLSLCASLAPQATLSDSDQLAAAQAQAIELPALEVSELAAWRAHIRPQAEEVAYESIPWLSEFSEGLQAASDEGKPLLFWAMNGHPLGTT